MAIPFDPDAPGAWTSLFDIGPCTVVMTNDEEEVFSQIMAKGDSQTFESIGREYTITIGEDGSVTLDGADEVSSGMFEIGVQPNYEHNFPTRMREISVGENVDYAGGQLALGQGFSGPTGSFKDFSPFSPPTPDPLDMSEFVGADNMVSMYFLNREIG